MAEFGDYVGFCVSWKPFRELMNIIDRYIYIRDKYLNWLLWIANTLEMKGYVKIKKYPMIIFFFLYCPDNKNDQKLSYNREISII